MNTGDRHSHRDDEEGPSIYRPYDSNTVPPGETVAPGVSYRHLDEKIGPATVRPGSDVRAAVAAELHPVRMPDDVAARIRARLTAELHGAREDAPGRSCRTASGGLPGPRWFRRGRRAGRSPGTAGYRSAASAGPGRRPVRTAPPTAQGRARRTAVLLAVLGALVAVPVLARPAPGPVPVAGTAPEELWHAAADASAPAGPAVDPEWVRSCLTNAGATDPDAPLLGARPYPVAGEPGVLLVLGTGGAGHYRLVVVTPDCGRIIAETPT